MKQGADVNGGDHEHGYSTLHFATLANKVEICQILLENGVKVDRTNSVKRTASQMAAFVGKSNTFNFQLKFPNKLKDFFYLYQFDYTIEKFQVITKLYQSSTTMFKRKMYTTSHESNHQKKKLN